jgi:hypothetical protein
MSDVKGKWPRGSVPAGPHYFGRSRLDGSANLREPHFFNAPHRIHDAQHIVSNQVAPRGCLRPRPTEFPRKIIARNCMRRGARTKR